MKLSELGIDIKTGAHDKRLTEVESRFVTIIWVHVGEKNAVPADVLAGMFIGGMSEDISRRYTAGKSEANERNIALWKRDVRHIHNHILFEHDKCPIISKAGKNGGYWLAETEAEASKFYESQRKRAMTGFKKATRGKQAAIVDAVQQLSFEIDGLVDKSGMDIPKRQVSPATPIAVVDAMLKRMTENPEVFADGLRKIGAKYGSVLLPKAQIIDMKKRIADLSEMIAGLGV
jgi:hypothetical protein